MFGKLDLSKEIKIPKGVVMMLKSFGLDAKELEANLLKLGNQTITILSDADNRLCSLANQHQLLHEEKQKLVADVALLHMKLDRLLATSILTAAERDDVAVLTGHLINGEDQNGSAGIGNDSGSSGGNGCDSRSSSPAD